MCGNIILTGFKSSGKSTIGRALAESLQCEFCDIDTLIEKEYISRYGGINLTSAREIYLKNNGRVFFELESRIVKKIGNMRNCVISTAGSTILALENYELLKRLGKIVYLFSEWNVIESRIRKLIDKGVAPALGEMSDLCKLYRCRLPIYENRSDVVVFTNEKSTIEIVNEIKCLL